MPDVAPETGWLPHDRGEPTRGPVRTANGGFGGMSLLQRTAEGRAGGRWREIEHVLGADELRLGSARLHLALGLSSVPGTLFLTDHRLVWLPAEQRRSRGSGFDLPVDAIDVVGVQQGVNDPGAFVVGLTRGGEFEALLFLPHSASTSSVAMAEQMSSRIRGARNRRIATLRQT